MIQKRTHLVVLNNYMVENDENTNPLPIKPKNQPKSNNLDPAIGKVIKDASMIHLVTVNEKKQKPVNELDAMIATCQEFMQSFIILGYDLKGQPIQPIVFAHNQQEADALCTYMSKFTINNNSQNNMSG